MVDRRVALTLTDSELPHLADSSTFVSGNGRWDVLRNSKLMLNVHRSDLGYLEWLRVIGAIVNGCVVVTEHSFGFEPLVPGKHFISASYDNLPLAIDALLVNPSHTEEIRKAAYDYLREEIPLSRTIAPLVDAIGEVASRGSGRSFAVPMPVPASPRRLTSRATEYDRIFAHRSDMDRVRAALKDVLLGQLELRRQLSSLAGDEAQLSDEVEHTGPRGLDPRVSVILTVYNYAGVVPNAIASVADSDYDSRELVVVDDCSRDDSLDVVRAEIARRPNLPATIVSRGRNQGLAAARNCGLSHASGELVFILDADNAIYPHCLSRLVGALDEDPLASFAYGMIEMFGPEGPRDLLSWHAWEAERLRFGNYIDAMAMIRRRAIEDVGGYSLDRRLQLGWEDFDLWCAFADRGWHGIQVAEILSRYRTGTYSMLSTTDIDAQAAWGALVERHSFLHSHQPAK